MKTKHESYIKPEVRLVYQELHNGRWITLRKIELGLKPFPSKRIKHWYRYWSHGEWKASCQISLTQIFNKFREYTVREVNS